MLPEADEWQEPWVLVSLKFGGTGVPPVQPRTGETPVPLSVFTSTEPCAGVRLLVNENTRGETVRRCDRNQRPAPFLISAFTE